MPEHAHQQVTVGDEAVDARAGERGREAPRHPGPVRAAGDDLGQHRVVVHADLRPALDPRVQPQAVRRRAAVAGLPREPRHLEAGVDARHLEQPEGAALRAPVARGVLGVEAHLDGVAARLRRLSGQAGALGDLQLQAHQVDAVHALGHRVLDLEPRVHLQERDGVPLDEELDGARADVADRLGGPLGGLEERIAHAGGHPGRRGLLDDLLVPALDRALALAERPHRAVRVRQDLDLDVPGLLQERLDEDGAVPERRQRLAPGRRHGLVQLGRVAHDAHAAPAAAGRRLHQHREHEIPGLGGLRDHRGRHGHPGLGHQDLGLDLGAHRGDGRGARADPGQARVQHGPGERGVLRQEPVAGMDGVRPGVQRRRDDRVGVEVGVGGPDPAQPYGVVGLGGVR